VNATYPIYCAYRLGAVYGFCVGDALSRDGAVEEVATAISVEPRSSLCRFGRAM
jgi:hypothetical protein